MHPNDVGVKILFIFELMKATAKEVMPVRRIIRIMANIVKRKHARTYRDAQSDVMMGKLMDESLKSGLADKNEVYKFLGRI